jgi:hypothetical protein
MLLSNAPESNTEVFSSGAASCGFTSEPVLHSAAKDMERPSNELGWLSKAKYPSSDLHPLWTLDLAVGFYQQDYAVIPHPQNAR